MTANTTHMTFTAPPADFDTTPVELDYVDFVSHLGPDPFTARRLSADTVKAQQMALDAAIEARDEAARLWQEAVEAEARTAAYADVWAAFVVRSADRILRRGQVILSDTQAQMDALTDMADEKARLARYRAANARSDYFMAVMQVRKLTGERAS